MHWTFANVAEKVTTRVWYHAVKGDPYEEVTYLGPSAGYPQNAGQVDIMHKNGQIYRTHINSLTLTTTRW